MSKPTGLVTLNTDHSLYDGLIGIVPFTEQDTDGPARMLEPAGATDMTYTDNNVPDEPENAWNNDPPSFSTSGATDERVYTTNYSSGIIPHLPCSIALHINPNSTNPGFVLGLRDSSSPTTDNLWVQMGNTPGDRLKVEIEKTSITDSISVNPGAWVAGTDYSIVINIHDTAKYAFSSVPNDGDTILLDESNIVTRTYTWRDTITTTANEVKRTAGDAVACRTSLRHAINSTGTPGTDYGSNTVIHGALTAVDDGDDLRAYRKADIPGDGLSGRLHLNDSGSYGAWDAGRLGILGDIYYGDAFVEVFVNGASAGSHQLIKTFGGTPVKTYPTDVDELEIGTNEGSSGFSNATLDMVAFFDRALSEYDIIAWHDEGPAGLGNYSLFNETESSSSSSQSSSSSSQSSSSSSSSQSSSSSSSSQSSSSSSSSSSQSSSSSSSSSSQSSSSSSSSQSSSSSSKSSSSSYRSSSSSSRSSSSSSSHSSSSSSSSDNASSSSSSSQSSSSSSSSISSSSSTSSSSSSSSSSQSSSSSNSSSSFSSSSSRSAVDVSSYSGIFLFYADYFAYIAEAGLNRARELFPGIATSTLVDVTTIINRPNTDLAKANLTRMLDTSYEYLWLDAQHIDPIRDAFNGLAKYILKKEGLGVNSYLEKEEITVLPLYARLSNIFDEIIEDENIRSS